MLKRYRKALLLLTLAGAAGLAVFAPPLERPVDPALIAPPAHRVNGSDKSHSARNATGDDGSRKPLEGYPGRGVLEDSSSDLFAQQSWQPPSPKSANAPQPVSQPPPMTYRFAGRLLQDGQLQVFVSKGDKPVAVKAGETLEGGYVVESLTTDSIHLIYPPLGHRASIAIPPAVPEGGSEPQ